jgi:glutaredoxin
LITLELFSKENCSLCEKAKAVIERARRKIPFEYRETLLVPGTDLEKQMRLDIPVLHINGAFFARHFVSERQLIERLEALAPSREKT